MNYARALHTGLAAACIAVAAALPVQAQTLVGSLDVVDQQSVLGWACLSGDAITRVDIELWALHTALGQWIPMGAVHADKQRNDVGSAGVCGTGIESHYHGFELAVYPDSVLQKNKSFAIYAYYRIPGGLQPLNGSGRVVGFPEVGLPTSGYWRTDFDDPNGRQPALLSCIWPYHGANKRTNESPDDYWIDPGAGPTWLGDGPPSPLGFVTPSTWCINYSAQTSPSPWRRSNSNTNAPAPSWPTGNFWVLHVNYEPAFSQLNSGPPSQSQPLNAGEVYSIVVAQPVFTSRGFTLGIDNTKKSFAGLDGIPFISFGAQMGRGSAGPIAFIDPTGVDTYVQFTAARNLEQGTDPYHPKFLFIEAMWGGGKRMIVVSLQEQITVYRHWNWNVYPSFFYPGAEINFISTDDIGSHCALPYVIAPRLDSVPVGVVRRYSIPIRALFQCIDNIAVPGLGWMVPRPTAQPLLISGIHLAIEQGPGRLDNRMETTFSLPWLRQR